MQRLHAWVRVRPSVVELILHQRAEEGTQRRTVQQERARWDQEADRVLHGIDGVDEVVRIDELQQLPVVVEGRPRREGHPRRTQRDAGRAHGAERGLDVGAGVSLVEVFQDGVTQ